MALLIFTPNPLVTTAPGGTTFRFDENQTTGTVVGTIRNATNGLDYRITAQPTGATRYGLVERMEGTQRVLDVVIIDGGEANINFEALNGQHPITVEGYNGSNRVDAGSFTFNLN